MTKRVYLGLWLVCSLVWSGICRAETAVVKRTDRAVWVETLVRIADPVLTHLAQETLKAEMPYESLSTSRKHFSYLEAFGRTVCGIAPWLELGADETWEGQLRRKYIELTVKGISNAVNPDSPDYLAFDAKTQALVDAAFLAEGLLRAPVQLWGRLNEQTQLRVIKELKRTRTIKPNESNWLLFTSTIEAALLEFTGTCDKERLLYGVKRFRDDWYCGDAQYSDGEKFHVDYYNSFVIHPMLTDVLRVMQKHGMDETNFLTIQNKRLGRLAEQLERLISPEGTYPVVGRSIVYRTGVFHALGQAALLHQLPSDIAPSQVRSALTSVIKRQFGGKRNANFDAKGWLTVGFNGHQLGLSEAYINTGSTYLCLAVFLPLGLPEEDLFWKAPFTPWTTLKAWEGGTVKADRALSD
ncbi:MAG: DUF2264 domain-containing protein [Bacteroidia bacterium]|nr:DUF2264 domain-containing protein [Bacteroidia bacterium]